VFPVIAVILAIVYLYVMVRWILYFWRHIDPMLRERIGKRFGVTITKNFRNSWEVVEKNLIEMLQPSFLIPAMFLPVIIFALIVMLLAQLGILK